MENVSFTLLSKVIQLMCTVFFSKCITATGETLLYSIYHTLTIS